MAIVFTKVDKYNQYFKSANKNTNNNKNKYKVFNNLALFLITTDAFNILVKFARASLSLRHLFKEYKQIYLPFVEVLVWY
jgi:hypothetical protein